MNYANSELRKFRTTQATEPLQSIIIDHCVRHCVLLSGHGATAPYHYYGHCVVHSCTFRPLSHGTLPSSVAIVSVIVLHFLAIEPLHRTMITATALNMGSIFRPLSNCTGPLSYAVVTTITATLSYLGAIFRPLSHCTVPLS